MEVDRPSSRTRAFLSLVSPTSGEALLFTQVQPTPPPPESGTAVLDKLKAEAAKIGATVEISALSDGELLGLRVRLPRGYHWKDGHSWEGHGPTFVFGGSQHWQEKCARLIAELARVERCRDDTCE